MDEPQCAKSQPYEQKLRLVPSYTGIVCLTIVSNGIHNVAVRQIFSLCETTKLSHQRKPGSNRHSSTELFGTSTCEITLIAASENRQMDRWNQK